MLALATAVGLTEVLVAGLAVAVRAAEAGGGRLEQQMQRSQMPAELGTVVASVAHELNNPIGAIVTFAELVRDAPNLPPELREDIDLLTGEARQVAVIARQLPSLVRDGERPPARPDPNHLV